MEETKCLHLSMLGPMCFARAWSYYGTDADGVTFHMSPNFKRDTGAVKHDRGMVSSDLAWVAKYIGKHAGSVHRLDLYDYNFPKELQVELEKMIPHLRVLGCFGDVRISQNLVSFMEAVVGRGSSLKVLHMRFPKTDFSAYFSGAIARLLQRCQSPIDLLFYTCRIRDISPIFVVECLVNIRKLVFDSCIWDDVSCSKLCDGIRTSKMPRLKTLEISGVGSRANCNISLCAVLKYAVSLEKLRFDEAQEYEPTENDKRILHELLVALPRLSDFNIPWRLANYEKVIVTSYLHHRERKGYLGLVWMIWSMRKNLIAHVPDDVLRGLCKYFGWGGLVFRGDFFGGYDLVIL